MSEPLRAYCEVGDHYPDTLIASVPEDLDPDGLGVLVNGDGTVTNRWGDGVAGVPAEARRFADEDEQPWCAEHREEIAHW